MDDHRDMKAIRRRLPVLAAGRRRGRAGGLAPARPADAETPPTTIRLGSLAILPDSRTLLVDGLDAELGGRAFDLLMALLDAEGGIVARDDLIRRVWPTVTVADGNLKVQLSLLRRALGPERWRIKTVSGRGYMLVAHDRDAAGTAVPAGAPATGRPLIIVVDADPRTQALVMRAVSELARYCAGAARLALMPG